MFPRGIYSRTKTVLLFMQFVGDGAAVLAGLMLGYAIRFYTPLKHIGTYFGESFGMRDYTPLMFMGVAFFIATLAYLRAYDARNLLRPKSSRLLILRASFFWLLLFLGVSLFVKFDPGISRAYALISAATVLLAVLAWRSLFLLWLVHSKYHARLRQRILLIGWNSEAARFVRAINDSNLHPDEVIGWLRPQSAALPPAPEEPPADCPCLGSHADLETVVRDRSVNIAILVGSGMPGPEILRDATICERLYAQLKIMPSGFGAFVANLRLQTVAGIPLLGVEELPVSHMFNAGLKRLTDIAGALVGLAASAPVIALLAFLIKRESPGPVFYKQVRTGRHGKPFNIYKLRSMRPDAEKSGAQWAVADDPRRLKIGAFMRATNLDELPQFWNVLRGDMSLVGPRPERPELIERFEREIPHYNPRHEVRPGITGWAQVNGLRGNTSLVERINYDLYYIENWSLWFDFQIMLMTFGPQKNAY
ncbi:MAG: sugar transferase [Opitutaceae bacterium]|jgi:exopolysaccharide biosynthesis polyprenyl glycosylphosphotransferase|nr:sugar transferase [Opitutaceae bacterium]